MWKKSIRQFTSKFTNVVVMNQFEIVRTMWAYPHVRMDNVHRHMYSYRDNYFFRPWTVEIAPLPSAKLESRNPVGLAQFFSIAPPLISTHSYPHFQPSPEVPVVIQEYFFPTFTPPPLLPPLLLLPPSNPPLPPSQNCKSTLDPLSHRNDNTGAEEVLR